MFNTNFLKEFIKTKNIKTLLALIEAINDDIVQLKIDKNKSIIIENPNLDVKPGDYINIISEKGENANITHAKELFNITVQDDKTNVIKFTIFNENIQMKLNGNINNPQIKNFITWLGKFIKHLKNFDTQNNTKNISNINKNISNNTNRININNFVKLYIKEVAKGIIEDKNIKVPDPKSSSETIIKLFNNNNDSNAYKENDINENTINEKAPVTKNLEEKVLNESVLKENYSKENDFKENTTLDQSEETLNVKPLFQKALNAYKTFSNIENIQGQNFILFQIFNIPIFLSINDILEHENQTKKKIKRISFSFISNSFGLINTIIYKKDNAVSLIFNIQDNIDVFRENIDELLNNIKSEGINIEALQVNVLENDIVLNKKGLYG